MKSPETSARPVAAGILPVAGGILPPGWKRCKRLQLGNRNTRLEAGRYGSQGWLPLPRRQMRLWRYVSGILK